MIKGVGVDIVEIERIRSAVKDFGDHVLDRIFTLDEVAYCTKRRDPNPSLAARFAAKEAMIKALPCEDSISLRDIEVYINELDKPCIHPSDGLKSIMDSCGVSSVHLSLSHERTFAVAYVVLESA